MNPLGWIVPEEVDSFPLRFECTACGAVVEEEMERGRDGAWKPVEMACPECGARFRVVAP